VSSDGKALSCIALWRKGLGLGGCDGGGFRGVGLGDSLGVEACDVHVPGCRHLEDFGQQKTGNTQGDVMNTSRAREQNKT